MRINTTDSYEWRTDLYDRVGDLMNESTRSGAVDASAQFTEEMIKNLNRAMDHEDMTEDLAKILSTSQVELEYEVRSDVNISD